MTAHLVLPVDGGLRMRVDMSDVVGSVLATSGVWEPYVVSALARTLSPGDVCVDVGAHVGYHSLVAAKLVGPTGHVYALEPSTDTYRDLCANVELNALSNVTALAVAAGASDGYGSLVASELDNVGRTSIQRIGRDYAVEPSAPARVEIRALRSVLDPAHMDRLRLVKIDVEGFETEVLRGLERLFAEGARTSVIVELHPDAAKSAIPVIARLVASYGLGMYELARNPHLERFAPIPPPRPLRSAEEMFELCERRTTNVLLADDCVASSSE